MPLMMNTSEEFRDTMASTSSSEATDAEAPPKKRGRGLLIALIAAPVLLGGGAGAAYVFVPGVSAMVGGLLGGSAAKAPPPIPVAPKPAFVDLPEMAITLASSSQGRQMRIRISLELMQTEGKPVPPDILTPRVYDLLLTYLRTLSDAEIESSLAIDRIRGDLFRRLTLLLGGDVVRDVLITSFVVA
jgi:flagellar FliL protein